MKVGIVTTGKGGGIPQLEIRGLASRIGSRWKRKDRRFYTVAGNDLRRFYALAYSRVVGVYRFSFRRGSEIPSKIKDLRQYVLGFPSFAVFGERKREVGWWLDGKVSLENPSQMIYVHRGKRAYHVLSDAKIISGKDFSWRDSRNRPVFHPSSMNARDARFLVNSAGVMPGDTVLDPFCGVGGILIEAGLVGARVIGIDIDERMVDGCRKNLRYYGIAGEVRRGDARNIDVEADIVITDPPYGRSSKTVTRDLRSLYMDTFENLHGIVKRRMVVVLPFEGEGLLERSGFEILGKARWYIHGSLTRRVYLCSP